MPTICQRAGIESVSNFNFKNIELMKMDINVDKSLIKVVRTGSVIIGANRTIDAAEQGNAKLVVLASNCPEHVKAKVEETGVPVLVYEGTSVELGPICGKPFTIAAMAVLDAGESDILAAVA